MKFFALLAVLTLLILPFAMTTTTINDSKVSENKYGLLYYQSHNSLLDSTSTQSIQSDWMDDNGVYDSYFGNAYQLGVIVLLLIVVALGFALFTSKDNKIAGILVVIAAILLIYLRFQVLSDDNMGFIYNNDSIFGTFAYTEIPLGPIIALILGTVDLVKHKN